MVLVVLASGCVIEPNPSPFGSEGPNVPGGIDGADGGGTLDSAAGSDGYSDGIGQSSSGQDASDAVDGGMDATDTSDGTDETTWTDQTDTTDSSATTDAIDSTDFIDGLDLDDCLESEFVEEEEPPSSPVFSGCSNAACDTPPSYSELAFKISSLRLLSDPSPCDSNSDGVVTSEDSAINNATGYIRDRLDRGLNRWVKDGTLSLVLELSTSLTAGTAFWANLYEVIPQDDCVDTSTESDELPWTFWNGTLCDYAVSTSSYADACPTNMIPTMALSENKIQTITADTSWSSQSEAGSSYNTQFISLRSAAETEVQAGTMNGVICGHIAIEAATWHVQNFSELLGLSDGTEPESAEIAAHVTKHLSCDPIGLCTFALEFTGHPFGALSAPALPGSE